MAELLFDCPDSELDFLFSSCLEQRRFKLKWVILDVSKIPPNRSIPSPAFQLLSEGECRLQLLNDLDDIFVFLYKRKELKPSKRPCPCFEYTITKYNTTIYDVNGRVLKRIVVNDRQDESFQLLKTRILDPFTDDTMIITFEVTALMLCNYLNK